MTVRDEQSPLYMLWCVNSSVPSANWDGCLGAFNMGNSDIPAMRGCLFRFWRGDSVALKTTTYRISSV